MQTVGALAVLAVLGAAVGASPAAAAVGARTDALGPHHGASTVDAGAMTITKQVSRKHVEADGSEVAVDSRTVSLTVSQTKDLHSRQPIDVTWSGARPTAGTVGDPNSPEARQQEYPFVLIECRGTDSPTAPMATRLTPETCWTGTTRERVLSDRETGFGPWRLDRYEDAADRTAFPGVPSPLPKGCDPDYAQGERWLHFTDVKGKDFASDGGGGTCGTTPPESVTVDSSSQPANTTYAATQLDGTGGTRFTTWTSEDNASLGCGGTVACSLVAIPIEGISCDAAGTLVGAADRPPAGKKATAARTTCEATGAYKPGVPASGGTPDTATTGALWFSESNWRNRITVPLHFAPLNNVCDAVGGKTAVDIYGSELLAQLTNQWRPSFCLDSSRTPFNHVQVGEPQAANLQAAGNVRAAFVSDPPGGTTPADTVLAPISFSGFAISYAIDDAKHDRYTKLRLDARLVAKLLTESYPGVPAVRDSYAALSRNPLDITQDPEFIALNPGITHGVNDSAAASTLLTLSSDSDVVEAMTRWIAADPEAKDFLYGVADPWGMVVNPSYTTNPHRSKNPLVLPVDNWPLRDTFEPKAYYDNGNNICLQSAPVPILPLIAAPTARLASVAQSIQFGISNAQLNCQSVQDQGSQGAKLVAEGRQNPGYRFVLGVTSLGDADRYDLDTASLQTRVSDTAPDLPTDASGRTFVAPTQASLQAAAALLQPDDTTGSWHLPYDELVGPDASKKAYPGAMLISALAATKGLDASTAKGLGQLLTFAAGPGQVSGLAVGQVPPGFLPLTAANGLGAERTYTARAASLIAAQHGGTAHPSGHVDAAPGASAGPTSASSTGATGTTGGLGDGTTGVAPPPAGLDATPGAAAPAGASPAVAPAVPQLTPAAALGTTRDVSSGAAVVLLPLLLVLGVIGGLCSLLARRVRRPVPVVAP